MRIILPTYPKIMIKINTITNRILIILLNIFPEKIKYTTFINIE